MADQLELLVIDENGKVIKKSDGTEVKVEPRGYPEIIKTYLPLSMPAANHPFPHGGGWPSFFKEVLRKKVNDADSYSIGVWINKASPQKTLTPVQYYKIVE